MLREVERIKKSVESLKKSGGRGGGGRHKTQMFESSFPNPRWLDKWVSRAVVLREVERIKKVEGIRRDPEVWFLLKVLVLGQHNLRSNFWCSK